MNRSNGGGIGRKLLAYVCGAVCGLILIVVYAVARALSVKLGL